jgi:tetratricopeptide (TPR) repeat protein
MTKGKPLLRMSAVTAALLLATLTAFGFSDKSNGKTITFTTKSKEAKDYIAQIVKLIESFQGGPQGVALARKAVEADPQFAFAHYLVGANSPPPQAMEHINKAFELAKNASEAERRYIEAIIKLRTQKPAEALAIFEELGKQYPEERMVQMMLGQVYTNQGRVDEGKAAFERALKLDSSTPRVYAFLGNIHLLQGDYAKARELYTVSLSKKVPGSVLFPASFGTVFSYVHEGNYDAALKVLSQFQEEYNKSPNAANFPPVFIWNAIGRLLLESGKPAEALKAYQKGYESVPGSSLGENDKKAWLGRMHHGMGRSLAKMGKHEEAWKEAELIKKMIDEGGEEGKQYVPAYHYIAGYLKLEAKQYPQAIEHLKQADLTDPFHKLLLARALERSGDEAGAQKLYKEIVENKQITMERALAYPEAKKKLKS